MKRESWDAEVAEMTGRLLKAIVASGRDEVIDTGVAVGGLMQAMLVVFNLMRENGLTELAEAQRQIVVEGLQKLSHDRD